MYCPEATASHVLIRNVSKQFCYLALLLWFCATPLSASGDTIYTANFQSPVGAEWSNRNRNVTPRGQRLFLGQFSNESVTLTLNNLPPHSQMTLSFDLYVIRSWDGSQVIDPYGPGGIVGPDIWQVALGSDQVLLRTTFSNVDHEPYHYPQAYPGSYGGTLRAAGTGAVENNTLGYTFTYQEGGTLPADSVYRLSFDFDHSASSCAITFSAEGLQGIDDESWGLDNVKVETPTAEQCKLKISSSEGGSVTTPGEGEFTYDCGSSVDVVATPDDCHSFANWTGTAVDNDNVANPSKATITVTLDGDSTLIANFTAKEYCLTITATEGGRIIAEPGGTVEPNQTEMFCYACGDTVNLTVEPDSTHYFSGWGDNPSDSSGGTTRTITVGGDSSFSGEFKPNKLITGTNGESGSGSIVFPAGEPDAYDCNIPVHIIAKPEPCYHFTHWSGTAVVANKVDDPNAADIYVTVDADYTLIGHFAPDGAKKLTLSSGDGGSVSTPGEGTFEYECGTSVPVVATPDACYVFAGWSGTAVDANKVANVDAPNTTVLVDANDTLHAEFTLLVHELTVSSTDGGSVTEPGEGTFEYECTTSVPIVATPDECYVFAGWSGTAVDANKVANVDAPNTTVLVDANDTLHAEFTLLVYELTVSSTDGGSVTEPGEGTFEYECASEIPLLAEPDPGWCFVKWTGTAVAAGMVADANASSTMVVVDGNHEVVAVFEACKALPEVKTLPADEVTAISARLLGQLISDGNDLCEWRFCYWVDDGNEPSYTAWQSIAETDEPLEHILEGLLGERTYCYEAEVRNSMGTAFGGVECFSTPPWMRLTLSSSAGGQIVEPNVPVIEFSAATDVTVIADADPGSYFWCWQGTAVERGKIPADDLAMPLTVAWVDGDDTLRATFLRAISDWPDDVERSGRRGGQSSTSQLWDFGDTVDDVNGIPDGIYDVAGPAPGGLPPLPGTVLTCVDTNSPPERWWPDDPCAVTGRKGISASNGLEASINIPPSDGELTSVWMQIVWREHAGAEQGPMPPDGLPGPVLIDAEPFLGRFLRAEFYLAGGWYHTSWAWLVDPDVETINFTVGGPIMIDCMIVDTYVEGAGLLREP